jgi:monovalent cation/hydrogen antiporter
MELLAVAGVILVVAAATIAPRLGVSTPLLLVALGFGVAQLPFVQPVVVDPEWVLAGVLPPLLYSAAVSTPVMEFRRDLRLISTFSVLLVLATSAAIAWLAIVLVPGLPLGIGLALGAIISPTDAVATSIVRKAGVSTRLVTVLEGESMLNDASALVLLRSAVAAVGVSISIWQLTWQFVWAVAAALAIGWTAAQVNLFVRRWIKQVPANVALSLVMPFIAFLPAEQVGASGLVAAVAAGLVTGYGAPARMGAEERIAERAVWRTIELLLESAVFLLVGLELPALTADLGDTQVLGHPIVLALLAGATVIAVRTVFVTAAVRLLAYRNRRAEKYLKHLGRLQAKLAHGELPKLSEAGASKRPALGLISSKPERISRWKRLVTRRIADLDYLASEQFDWRDGMILVWAGMRGAVTIAAAQSLPAATTHRSLLVLTATLVAVGTLAIQGLTLRPLAHRLGITGNEAESDPELWRALQGELDLAALQSLPLPDQEAPTELLTKVRERLKQTAEGAGRNWFGLKGADADAAWVKFRELRLAAISAQRDRLLTVRGLGGYPSAMLDDALAQLDAQQISIELRQQYD